MSVLRLYTNLCVAGFVPVTTVPQHLVPIVDESIQFKECFLVYEIQTKTTFVFYKASWILKKRGTSAPWNTYQYSRYKKKRPVAVSQAFEPTKGDWVDTDGIAYCQSGHPKTMCHHTFYRPDMTKILPRRVLKLLDASPVWAFEDNDQRITRHHESLVWTTFNYTGHYHLHDWMIRKREKPWIAKIRRCRYFVYSYPRYVSTSTGNIVTTFCLEAEGRNRYFSRTMWIGWQFCGNVYIFFPDVISNVYWSTEHFSEVNTALSQFQKRWLDERLEPALIMI